MASPNRGASEPTCREPAVVAPGGDLRLLPALPLAPGGLSHLQLTVSVRRTGDGRCGPGVSGADTDHDVAQPLHRLWSNGIPDPGTAAFARRSSLHHAAPSGGARWSAGSAPHSSHRSRRRRWDPRQTAAAGWPGAWGQRRPGAAGRRGRRSCPSGQYIDLHRYCPQNILTAIETRQGATDDHDSPRREETPEEHPRAGARALCRCCARCAGAQDGLLWRERRLLRNGGARTRSADRA